METRMIIVARVRSRGAIGTFYDKIFELHTSKERYKDDWFAAFGNYWELNHFVSIRELKNEQVT